MLYNPQWKRESVHDLIAWLETKPAEGRYDFCCSRGCLIAQWMEGIYFEDWPQEIRCMHGGYDPGRIAIGPVTPDAATNDAMWTYGAALARARARAAVAAVPEPVS